MKKILILKIFIAFIVIAAVLSGNLYSQDDPSGSSDKPFTYMGDSVWITTTEYVVKIALMIDSLEQLSEVNSYNEQLITKYKEQLINAEKQIKLADKQIAYKDSINQANEQFIDILLQPKQVPKNFFTLFEFQTEIGVGTMYNLNKENKSTKFYNDLVYYGSVGESLIINKRFKITGEVKIPETIELKLSMIVF